MGLCHYFAKFIIRLSLSPNFPNASSVTSCMISTWVLFIFAKRGPIQQSLPLRVTVTINRVRPLVTYNLKISLLPRHIYAVKSTRSDPKYFSDQWLYRPSFHSIPGPLNAAFSQLPSNGLIVRSPTLAKVTNYSVKFGHFQATRKHRQPDNRDPNYNIQCFRRWDRYVRICWSTAKSSEKNVDLQKPPAMNDRQ